MSVEKDLWVFNTHLTALDAKIGEYDMEIGNGVLSKEETNTVKVRGRDMLGCG